MSNKVIEIESVQPISYYVFVEPIGTKTRNSRDEIVSGGGIILDQAVEEAEEARQGIGIVHSIGNFAWKNMQSGANGSIDIGVKVGDIVTYVAYAGEPVPKGKDGIELRQLADVEIKGVVKGRVTEVKD